MRRALALAFAIGPAMSCFGAADYQCATDTECRWGERRGTCEPTHYCSYSDGECPSGRRYSDQAGDLADRCVDEDASDDTTSTSTAAATTSTESTNGATDESSTGPPPQPVCGNEVMEAGESCDDGNDVDGDGCNVDCVLSGTPRWDPPARMHSAAGNGNARFWDVDVRPDDTIIAVGLEDVLDQDALFVLWTGDGDVVWTKQYDRGQGSDIARGVTSAVGSEIYVVGESATPAEGWIGVVEPANGDVEVSALTGRSSAAGVAYMHPSRLVVGGSGSGFIGARAFNDMLMPMWIAEAAVPSSGIAAVAADGVRDIAYAAGQIDGTARVMRLAPDDPEPLVTLFDGPPSSGAQALEFGESTLVLGGYVGVGMRDGWVQRLSTTGTEQWSWSVEEIGEQEVEDVAIAPTGHIAAVGFTTGLAQDVLVWKLSPDGELLWTWSWEEPLPNDDIARAVAVRPDGDIVAVGSREEADGASDAWVVRLTP